MPSKCHSNPLSILLKGMMNVVDGGGDVAAEQCVEAENVSIEEKFNNVLTTGTN